jgi:hypothetical protein
MRQIKFHSIERFFNIKFKEIAIYVTKKQDCEVEGFAAIVPLAGLA